MSDIDKLVAHIRKTLTDLNSPPIDAAYEYASDGVKPDRMVTRFVSDALGVRNVAPEIAEELVRSASMGPRPEFPMLVPSTLDNKIWKYQRAKEDATPAKCRPELV